MTLPLRRQRVLRASIAWVAAASSIVAVAACSALFTGPVDAGDLFDSPLDGLTVAEQALFARGDAAFSRRFAPTTGLGPIFNNVSCFSCHSGDGRGRPETALTRIGEAHNDFLADLGGPQIQHRAVVGAEAEQVPPGVAASVRLPSPVFGVGLMEAIPDSILLRLADPDDRDRDGISGRANFVVHPPYLPADERAAAPQIGRFGRKGQVASLFQQTVEAYHQDIGVTSEFRPVENHNPRSSVPPEAGDLAPDPEIAAAELRAVVAYIRTLSPPAPGATTTQRDEGRRLFDEARCSACHVPMLRTGRSAIAALANRDVLLYSDLLLHDMGDALADNRADGSATGREWRTPPLWGLRLMRQFLNGEAFLMHDGRARSVDEAIRMHDGEARAARIAFTSLTAAQRAALLDFVESR
jgi:CxxC motif-containing protein (DUF1111 family)